MNLIGDILCHKSLAVVGLEKNTGKTECLNHILRNLPPETKLAVTSIGTDGERVDAVTRTSKPEITLRTDTVFGTAEKYYGSRLLTSEILDVGGRATSLGRTVTARALTEGKVMLSGPPSTVELKRWMDSLGRFGVELTIVDGALSRMSSASPAITDAIVLSTGAAFSADMNTLVRETSYRVGLINLPLAPQNEITALKDTGKGIWSLNEKGEVLPVSEKSAPVPQAEIADNGNSRTIYVAGALTSRILNMFSAGSAYGVRILVGDFTKIFVPSQEYRAFTVRGGRVEVLRRSHLLAVCVNPVSPNGMVLDSDELVARLSAETDVPVYDIMKNVY